MKLSVIIPVYNERETIEEILRKVESVNVGKIQREIIVVDDFSKDGTREILQELAKNKKIKLLFHDRNYGKGHAIKSGLKIARGDIILSLIHI